MHVKTLIHYLCAFFFLIICFPSPPSLFLFFHYFPQFLFSLFHPFSPLFSPSLFHKNLRSIILLLTVTPRLSLFFHTLFLQSVSPLTHTFKISQLLWIIQHVFCTQVDKAQVTSLIICLVKSRRRENNYMNKVKKILECQHLPPSVIFSCCTLKVISHHYKRKRVLPPCKEHF